MPLDDVFGEGQSKAGTDTGAAAGIDPIEPLGELRQMFRADTRSMVHDRDQDAATGKRSAYENGLCVFVASVQHRVGQQILEGLHKLRAVGRDSRQLVWEVETNNIFTSTRDVRGIR